MWIYVAIFVLSVFIDIFCAGWTSNIVAGNAVKASIWSALIYAGVMAQTIIYIEDHLMAMPAIVGHMLGTFLAVKFMYSKEQRK